MVIGWGVLVPLGIMSSIYRSKIQGGADGTWLKYHARLQVCGVCVPTVNLSQLFVWETSFCLLILACIAV